MHNANPLVLITPSQVLLDLHGNPGGESSEKPCGRSLKGWHFGTWRRGEALNCLKTVAHRYKDFACVAGLQVANETGRLVDPKKLVDHYADCAKVTRVCAGARMHVQFLFRLHGRTFLSFCRLSLESSFCSFLR